MTVTPSGVRTSGGAHRLDRLAAAAARDLAAQGVIVTERRTDAGPGIAAVAGVTRSRAVRLLSALGARERTLDGEPLPPEAVEATLDDLERVVTASADLGGRRVGAIHVLGSSSGTAEREPLVRAYAAHIAVALAASDGRGTRVRVSGRPAEALGDLPLITRSWSEFIGDLEAALAEEFGSGKIGLMLWQSERDALQMVPGSFGADRGTAASYRITVSNSQSNAARVFATGYPYLSNSALGDAGILQDYVHAFGIERLMSVPLALGDRRVGVLHVANKGSDYTLDDLWRLESLIPSIGRAILVADMLFALRRRQRLEGMLSAVAVAIASGKSMQEFLTSALDELTDATDADLVALVPGGADPIVWRAGPISAELEQSVLTEASRHPDFGTTVSGPHSAGDPGSTIMHMPVHLGTQRVGTLSTLRRRAEPFAVDERDALLRLAKLAALAWATERYQQQRAELARVEERHRIADDLHDDVAQMLFAAQLPLDAALETGGLDVAVAGDIEQARRLIAMADEALRSAIHQLSRQKAVGFSSELSSLVNEIERDFGIPIHLEIAERVERIGDGLHLRTREALLRFAREALVNAAKHAGPCRAGVVVGVTRRGRLTMTVTDDGVGMRADDEDPGHGIASLRRAIRRQGGTLRIHSAPTGGTTLNVSVPA